MLKVQDLDSIIRSEADYTVRLLHKTKIRQNLNKVIFGLILFDGNTSSWSVKFLTRKRINLSADSQERYEEAKQTLIERIQNYVDEGYRITVVTSGYHVTPW